MSILLHPPIGDRKAWFAALQPLLPEDELWFWPDDGDRRDIEFAAVTRLPDGMLAEFPRLRLICSLFAGQDALLSDPLLPNVPVVRADGLDGTDSMSTSVLVHVLRHFCQLPLYAMQQARGVWQRCPHRPKREARVSFLGLGTYGKAAAQRIAAEGFQVLGWSRSLKNIEHVRCFSGEEGLKEMLEATHILVNLLALTAETRGFINRDLLRQLAPGASLINLGRGAHLSAADLYWALDEGLLSSATLDVFEVEPPPPDARVWTDPRITLTPHIARLEYDIEDVARHIAKLISDFRKGRNLEGVVDVQRGY